MSNEKLAEALRNARSFVSLFHDDPAQVCVAEIDEALQAHAAEAAQPLPQMTDAEHAEILAKYGTPQAAEPVRQFRVVPKGSVWTDVKDPEIWASVTAHPESYETRVLYTHPQPAQDAKDAARYRFLATSDYVDVYAESSSKEDLDRRIDAIMASDAVAQAELAKESWR